MPTPDTNQSKNELQARESFDLFKFYEEAAEKTKTHIWSQTSWILSLSTAVLAFSVNLYVQHHNVVGFLWIVWIAALVGAALCFYLIWTLAEFGDHIRRDWTQANILAVRHHPSLTPFVLDPKKDREEEISNVMRPNYEAPFPKFCSRLQRAAWCVLGSHFVWAGFITCLSSNRP